MKLELANLGPVRTAALELAPLIVFVGPNNSGKSFAAQVMHATLSRNAGDAALRRFRFRRAGPLSPDNFNEGLSEQIFEILSERQARDFDQVTPEMRDFFAGYLEQSIEVYSRALVAELQRVTGADAGSLRRISGKRRATASIKLLFDSPKWSLEVVIGSRGVSSSWSAPNLKEVWGKVNNAGWRRVQSRFNRLQAPPRTYLLREVGFELFRACLSEVPIGTRYLPAARSGLMQSHKALSGSLVRQASLAGIREMNIPAMSGVVTEFLGDIVELDSDLRGHYSDFASRLEKELLHGHVEIDQSSQESAEVVYQANGGVFPLSRTSSMVSEVAPIVLYLRHVIGRHELLFIEEPEAHLHPAAQVSLARILVELVNAGLRVGLTTHSEYFLQQLNNSILAASVGGESANDSGYPAENRLRARDVGAYRFFPTYSGTVVEQPKTLPDEGIPSASFDEVSERLYTEMTDMGAAGSRR